MRQVLVFVLCSLLGMAELAAEDLASLRPAQRKAAIEKQLDQPLKWDLADREQVTLSELVEFVHEKHGLKIRWDAASLALFQGEQAPLAGLLAIPTSQQPTYYPSYPAPEASDPLAAPHSLPPSAAPDPSSPETRKPKATSENPQPAAPKPSDAPSASYPATSPYPPSPAAPSNVAAAPPPSSPATGQPYAAPPPGTIAQPYAGAPGVGEPEANRATTTSAEDLIASCGEAPIALSAVSLEQATVREGLQQLLDALPTTAGAAFSIGIPITTRALNLDLLVDENSVVITTQLRANAAKETRVYRLGPLSEAPPETLVRVITHSVRPWSWRSQVHEIADQLASRWPNTPLPLPKVEINMSEGVKLASSEGAGEPQPTAAFPGASEETVAATGQLLAGGAVAAVDTVVAALEIIHHGDPPTGVIEVLPGMLVITQSQGAHREIEELLSALREGK
jgi:hypothetical protein